MIFARYIGSQSMNGNFTQGKVYQAAPAFNESGAVNTESIHVEDDAGKRCTVLSSANLFEFLDEVYAVVLKSVAQFERGEVVTITDADDEFYDVKGKGFFKSSLFELLDRTNVVPDSCVLDTVSQRWVKVSRVDECLNVAPEGEGLRPVTDFRFPVGNDGVLSEPLFKCVNAEGLDGEIAEGHMYRAESVDSARELVFICNDLGNVQSYMMSRFTADL